MNDQNLIPQSQRTKSERREIARQGGVASGEARRIKSRGRKLLLDLLAMKEPDPQVVADLQRLGINPDDITEEVAIHLRQIQKAVRKADTNAYNSIMRTAGILKDEAQPAGNTFNLNLTLGSQEAIDGLRVALQTGAQPAKPTTDTED